ncbi:ester cyclase [Aestuariicoccus sp. MJ-SS9]|uniref:nuclear transport factor 2 family protein n=1 Tax=Aestuariicoccus sp. MJ-SS9 TaxID=3079855 RepID=UPI002908E70A|nr:ester cyclase [Aestuariicoccus sp. MJ-SS9]MDU8910837.1 ester cyclase [Aestuariicoccus sp. MJ-SS9]
MTDFRAETRVGLARLWSDGDRAILHPEALADLAWPLNRLTGTSEIIERFIAPLRAAITGLHRRDLLFIGGQNVREAGGTWCACVTHYVGTFNAPLWGIAPSRHLVFLRAGEFFRIENGQITEMKMIFDLPDLLRQCGRMPFPELGTEITFPAPATQDGLIPRTGDGTATLDRVQAMLADLHVFDPETGTSKGQTGEDGYWHRDMFWYGPAGIGSNFRWDGFVQDHRASFLHAFPDRKGGNHYCRIGDGQYAAVSGWPSMTMTWQGDYLGLKADGRALTLRVMDFYRLSGNQIMENWVTLDYGDLYAQMGGTLIG